MSICRKATPGAAILLLSVLWCVLYLVIPSHDPQHAWLSTFGHYLTAESFLTAGAVLFFRWRITRVRAVLRAALAVAAAGVAAPVAAMLLTLILDDHQAAMLAPVTRVALFAPVLAVLAGFGSGRARRTVPLAPVLLAGFFGPAIALALIVELDRLFLFGPLAAISVVAETALGCAWLALLWHTRRRALGLVQAAMAVMAVGEFVRAATETASGLVVGVVPCFGVVGGLLFAAAVVDDLRSVLRTEGTQVERVVRALADSRSQLARIERVQRERLHDARSAVFGVIGASELLAQSGTAVADRHLLTRMVTTELQRLQTMLDVDTAEQIQEFDLADVLGPTVLAHRIGATKVWADIVPVRVIGRPATTATVLDNLLHNARTHGLGATVTVRTEIADGMVAVIVADRGPGIPAHERAPVLLPGVRGSSASGAGSGLGLYLCAQAVQGQSGRLHLSSEVGRGTTVSFTVPLAVAATMTQAWAS